MNSKREIWVDDVKAFACILVVLGHFYQSMVVSDILPDSLFYIWFNDTVYLFHVQLFFICSGYLYQKYSDTRTIAAWGKNVWKKLIVLGVPYFVFSFLTWILKKLFEGSVNKRVSGLSNALFAEPLAPYWYLYVLFFLFAITVTLKKKREVFILIVLALVLKALPIFGVRTGIYLVGKIMEDWIWFLLGMALAFGVVKTGKLYAGIIAAGVFLAGSVIYHLWGKTELPINFVLGLTACFAVISIVIGAIEKRGKQLFGFLSKYTMPLFLMHTLFAASIRSVLFKLGIHNAIIHIAVGLIFTFVGPIVAMMIMEKLKPLDFAVYPGRYLKKKKEE